MRTNKNKKPIAAPKKIMRKTPAKTVKKSPEKKTSPTKKARPAKTAQKSAPQRQMTKKTDRRPQTLGQHRGKEKSIMRKKQMPPTDKIVPDTSVLIEGALSQEIEHNNLTIKEIIIPEAVLAELESQANRRKEIGYLGLDEIERLKRLADTQGFIIRFAGGRPAEFDIKYAKNGGIDSLIRQVAEDENAVLYTADVVQSKVARAKGVAVILYHRERTKPGMDIEDFFDATTMSVHIKENCSVFAKRGRPGAWEFTTVREAHVKRSEVEVWAKQIVEAAQVMRDGFIEIERPGSTIAQIGRYRIVITRPPFSDGNEITAVRPVKHMSIEEYKITEKLSKRLDEQAEGILIAGAPGHGKSTFAQALAEHYATKKKIIKTIEAPRDMVLPDEITQYAISHGSSEEVHDILLLSRPDYTFFDEMRNTDDFKLFADMRLSGVGMIGVMHATKAIEAIQRFLGRIELGVIPHVVDTVVFILNGEIGSVYSIKMTVKVPSGMTEADLARPVVEVHDFESGKLMFEVYTYGEQTVVIPVTTQTKKAGMEKFASEGIQRYFEKYANKPEVEVVSANKIIVRVNDREIPGLIGKGGEKIQRIEKELGLSVDVQAKDGKGRGGRDRGDDDDEERGDRSIGRSAKGKTISFGVQETNNSLTLDLGRQHSNASVDIFVDDEFLMTAHASKKGFVKLTKKNKLVRLIVDSFDGEGNIVIRRSGA